MLSNKSIKYCWLLITAVFVWSCADDDSDFPADSLANYIETLGLPIQNDSLIACAISTEIMPDPEYPGFPVEVIFFPLNEISDIRYYESSIELSTIGDYSLLSRKELQIKPLFNGYLQKFLHPGMTDKVLGVVTYVRNNKLFISDGIHIQTTEKPTEYADALLNINQDVSLSPNFSWTDGAYNDNVIYFHVIEDNAGNLVSGTYTIDKEFQFYNLDNVVLNIRDINPPPVLQLGQEYAFWLFGVNSANWVNLIAEKKFIAQ